MKVRFKKDYTLGRHEIKQGTVLEVPPALRDILLEEGICEEVKEKEGKEG